MATSGFVPVSDALPASGAATGPSSATIADYAKSHSSGGVPASKPSKKAVSSSSSSKLSKSSKKKKPLTIGNFGKPGRADRQRSEDEAADRERDADAIRKSKGRSSDPLLAAVKMTHLTAGPIRAA